MKVLHLLDSLNRGGAEMLALDLCRNARAGGMDLTFVASGGGDLEDDFRHSGVDFVRLQRKLPVDLKLVARLREIINQRGIQIVHCHQAVEALHLYLATLGTNIKTVLTLHGYIGDSKNRLALKYLVPRVDANIAVSYEFLDRFKNEDRFDTSRTFHVIYNGVDTDRLRRSGRKLRAELGLGEHQILLGTVGNFQFAVKDQMTICRALPQIFRQSPDARFVFVGGRSEAAPQLFDDCVEFCRAQNIGDRVHFLGKRSDIGEILNSLDIFVFSSLQEGMPIAVIEAMLSGLPAVVSDIGPLLEVSCNGDCASVFRRGDSEDLARQLNQLIANPGLRQSLGSQAKQWSSEQFGIMVHISNLHNLYKRLANEF
jgi:glycosyltransferase involved in cell wall biosynthesis